MTTAIRIRSALVQLPSGGQGLGHQTDRFCAVMLTKGCYAASRYGLYVITGREPATPGGKYAEILIAGEMVGTEKGVGPVKVLLAKLEVAGPPDPLTPRTPSGRYL